MVLLSGLVVGYVMMINSGSRDGGIGKWNRYIKWIKHGVMNKWTKHGVMNKWGRVISRYGLKKNLFGMSDERRLLCRLRSWRTAIW